MKFNNPYWSIKTKLELLEKWIIVHSIIYYELNTNIVSDEMFDNNCKQLVKGISKYTKEFKESKYYKVFKSFDGSTGFDLYPKLNSKEKKELKQLAEYLIRKYARG